MIKRALTLSAVTATLLGLAVPAGASAHRLTVSPNLIRNGYAEAAAGSTDGGVVPVPKWTIVTGTSFTAVQYGASGGFPATTDPGPAQRGANFFAGGPFDAVTEATQGTQIPIEDRPSVDAGYAAFTLHAFMGGWESQGDNAKVRVDWINQQGTVLGSNTIGPVTAAQRQDITSLKPRTRNAPIPVGARRFKVTMTMTRSEGSYNDGYVDNLTLKISTIS